MDTPPADEPPPTPLGCLVRALVPIAILAGGWFGFKLLSKPEEGGPPPRPAQRVVKTRVIQLDRKDHQTVIRTQGVVRPHNEAALTPQVSGKVETVFDELQDGSFFDAEDVLLKIGDEDFAAEVASATAQLARAKALYAQEKVKSEQARLNWEDLGYKEEPNELVLRLPQLREAEANVKAAEAALARAERDFERTNVRAPFDGRVLLKSVAVGQAVTPGTALATIYQTDFVEVRLPISAAQLAYLSLPENTDEPAIDVTLIDALTEGAATEWKGKIVGTEGALDAESRELFAIARVYDPFSLKLPPAERRPPLRVGQPVRAEIAGKVLDDVFAVPRVAVRKLNRIYLVDREGMQLERREIEPVWSDLDYLYVRDPEMPDGALLATTRLVYAPNVARVEILPDQPEQGEGAEGAAGAVESSTEAGP